MYWLVTPCHLFRETSAVTTLSPTPRTTLDRHHDRALHDRGALLDVLADALVCHLGVIVDGDPVVLPTAFGADPDGPDRGGTLYLHGSVAASSLRTGLESDLCVTVTQLDGLVLARSAFHHSMNYRSAVIRGSGRLVDDEQEKVRALGLIVDHVVPGRASTLRPHRRKELAATVVVALPLYEASVKQRGGDPVDDADDIAAGIWAGVVPVRMTAGDVDTSADAHGVEIPDHVVRRAGRLRQRE